MKELTDEQLDCVIGGATKEFFDLWKIKTINDYLSCDVKDDSVCNSILNDRRNYRVGIQRNKDDYK